MFIKIKKEVLIVWIYSGQEWNSHYFALTDDYKLVFTEEKPTDKETLETLVYGFYFMIYYFFENNRKKSLSVYVLKMS